MKKSSIGKKEEVNIWSEETWGKNVPYVLRSDFYCQSLELLGITEFTFKEYMQELYGCASISELNKIKPGYSHDLLYPFFRRPPFEDTHPLKKEMSNTLNYQITTLSQLVRIGKILKDTSDVVGVKSKRKELFNISQYTSSLFEFELLSFLREAGFNLRAGKGTPDFFCYLNGEEFLIEAKLIESYNMLRLGGLLLSDNMHNSGKLDITLHSGFMGKGQLIKNIKKSIEEESEQLLIEGKQKVVNDTYGYTITLNEGTERCFVSISDGKDLTITEICEKNILDALDEKRKKMTDVGRKVVALDVSSLYPSPPTTKWESESHEKWYPCFKGMEGRILENICHYLKENKTLDLVIMFLPNNINHWRNSPKEIINGIPRVILVTRDGVDEITEPKKLYQAFEQYIKNNS